LLAVHGGGVRWVSRWLAGAWRRCAKTRGEWALGVVIERLSWDKYVLLREMCGELQRSLMAARPRTRSGRGSECRVWRFLSALEHSLDKPQVSAPRFAPQQGTTRSATRDGSVSGQSPQFVSPLVTLQWVALLNYRPISRTRVLLHCYLRPPLLRQLKQYDAYMMYILLDGLLTSI
jgi:hypothetical protein